MSFVTRYVLNAFNTVSTALIGSDTSNMEEESDSAKKTPTYNWNRYKPSVEDVLAVKDTLRKISPLPQELLDAIIDSAEYWPHTTTNTTQSSMVRSGADENQFLLRSYPLGFYPSSNPNDGYQMLPEYKDTYSTLKPRPFPDSKEVPINATEEVHNQWSSKSQPRGEHPCRKIVFTIKSHDQGWGGTANHKGTYEGSYTWFDVGLEQMSAFHESELATMPVFQRRMQSLPPTGHLFYGFRTKYETAVMLQAWELAPFPQFRLNIPRPQFHFNDAVEEIPADAANIEYSREANKYVVPNSTVCGLRTIFPHTIAKQNEYEAEVAHQQPNHSHPETSQQSNEPTDQPSAPPRETSYHFEHMFVPDTRVLQKNICAERNTKEHVITMTSDDDIDSESPAAYELEKQGRGRATGNGELVKGLKVGDVVTVWAKARFRGWVNNVEDVKIEVYWAV